MVAIIVGYGTLPQFNMEAQRGPYIEDNSLTVGPSTSILIWRSVYGPTFKVDFVLKVVICFGLDPGPYLLTVATGQHGNLNWGPIIIMVSAC